jgi:hypothetical protein
MFTAQALYTIGQVAQQFGISRSRLAYLIEAGYVPQPSDSVPGRRLFSTADTFKLREALVNIGEIVPQADPTMPSHNDGMVA